MATLSVNRARSRGEDVDAHGPACSRCGLRGTTGCTAGGYAARAMYAQGMSPPHGILNAWRLHSGDMTKV